MISIFFLISLFLCFLQSCVLLRMVAGEGFLVVGFLNGIVLIEFYSFYCLMHNWILEVIFIMDLEFTNSFSSHFQHVT